MKNQMAILRILLKMPKREKSKRKMLLFRMKRLIYHSRIFPKNRRKRRLHNLKKEKIKVENHLDKFNNQKMYKKPLMNLQKRDKQRRVNSKNKKVIQK